MSFTAERVARARVAMGGAGLDALLLATGTNLCYLSGYPQLELTLARPWFLVLPRSAAPVLLVHEGRQYEARALGDAPDVRTYRGLSRAPVGELRAILRETGARRIGAELGFEQRLGIPVAELERIREAVAPGVLEDAAELLWRLRMVKSPAEQEALRRACRITAEAYAATFAALHGGMVERNARFELLHQQMRLGGGGPWAAVTSGPGNYDSLLGPGTERRLEPGDLIWFDGGCAVDGLYSDFGRAGVVGGPSAEQVEAQRLVHELTWEGVRMVRPGRPLAEIAVHLNAGVEGLGLPVSSNISGLAGRVGHGIGLDPTEPPHVSQDDPTVLKPGMAITLEPGIATAYGVFHVEENVLCTAEGFEVLSDAPRELRTIAG